MTPSTTLPSSVCTRDVTSSKVRRTTPLCESTRDTDLVIVLVLCPGYNWWHRGHVLCSGLWIFVNKLLTYMHVICCKPAFESFVFLFIVEGNQCISYSSPTTFFCTLIQQILRERRKGTWGPHRVLETEVLGGSGRWRKETESPCSRTKNPRTSSAATDGKRE